jgi:glutathione S-transferase
MKWAATIRNRTFTLVAAEVIEQTRAIFRQEIESGSYGGEAVKAKLLEATQELAEAILAVPDADLANEIQVDTETYLLADCFLHPYWNMVYHEGQINYIQTLYGDRESHSVF